MGGAEPTQVALHRGRKGLQPGMGSNFGCEYGQPELRE